MIFTLLFTLSVTFTATLIKYTAYIEEKTAIEYEAIKIIPEKKEVINPPLEKNKKQNTSPNILLSYNINNSKLSTSKVKKLKPIKIINDNWFMKHYDRICELEAISNRSVLDMYDHELIFQQFPDLKQLARNLAWEKQKSRVR